ncbi:hypothetical protein SAMN05421688_3061 [Poseidonocella pacifica]|uniref:histidine kinase n=1 Tax=Poseidonocella pacifica TaxID=871651 RepID=A0A1I0YGD2_9RHOB|nr:PAS-domain containing protein [Poseidonocella pacifica]SFB12291.1 hypothetical protein SAMN05421688_3061 [Poseidonocella pacifica]
MIDPADPLEVQVAKQTKIIDALVRRAGRQHEIGDSAYAAFQSAIALQGQIWARTRDLQRASDELEQVRFDRERTRKNLTDALSVMEGGFALFADGKLQIFNDLFISLLPDISDRILPGLEVEAYFSAVAQSRHLVSRDRGMRQALAEVRASGHRALANIVIEIEGDRWYQLSQQRTSSDNLVVLQTDITDLVRKNRSEKDHLIDMQAHYLQAAIDHMSVGIGTFSQDGTLMIRNARFGELLGLPMRLLQSETRFGAILDFLRGQGELARSSLALFDGWRNRLREEGRLRKRLRYRSGRVLELHAHRLPDGGFLVDVADATLEARATDILEKRVEERTSELTEANRRLTEQSEHQAQVEEELRLAKEAAEAAVSSKTRFLAAASHDLLQPINAAKLLISTLSDMTEGTEYSGVVERLERSFTSTENLLHALLDISRLESTGSGLSPSEFCLGPIMQAVIEDQAPVAAAKGVRLDVIPSSAWVRSDQRYLLRSIQNLVVNAIQYTDRGRVLVGCRKRGPDAVTLEVWDTGIGISHKDQTRIFEEFTRAENVPPGSGMGLGLSIVDRTCRHLGHVVGVRSKPGVGSVFSIEMARVAPHRLRPMRQLTLPEYGNGVLNLLVIVIENDPDVLFATVRKLESWGASVFGTRSTVEALEVVADMGIAPDIIVADYQLDGKDTGVEAITAVRTASGVHVPAIMVTADRGVDLVRIGEAQDFSVMPKPVNLVHLRSLIARKTQEPAHFSGLASGTDKSIA